MSTRICGRCLNERAYPDDFYRSSRMPDGRMSICKECEKTRVRAVHRVYQQKPRRKRGAVERTEEQIIRDEEKRVAAANERAFKNLIPIEWPARKTT